MKFILSLAVLVLMISPIKAGVPSPYTWQTDTVNVYIDAEFTQEEIEAIFDAINQINDLGLPVTYVYEGQASRDIEPSNEIYYLRRNRALVYKYIIGNGTAGRTIRQYLPTTQEFLYTSTQIDPQVTNTPELFARTILHELGHALGAEHTASPYERKHRPVMYATASSDDKPIFTYDDKATFWTGYKMQVENTVTVLTDTLCDWVILRNRRRPAYSIIMKPNMFVAHTTGVIDGSYRLVCIKGGQKIKEDPIKITKSGSIYFTTR